MYKSHRLIAGLLLIFLLAMCVPVYAKEVKTDVAGVVIKTATVSIAQRDRTITYVQIAPGALVSDITLAQESIGKTEAFTELAKRDKGFAAISGSMFQNFDSSLPKDPYGTLIKNGKLIHSGQLGSVLGITASGKATIENLVIKITGTVGKTTFAIDEINHTPPAAGNSVTLFTPERGSNIGFTYGTNIIVQKNQVIKHVENANTTIPDDGYVINLTGSKKTLAEQFITKSAIDYQVAYSNKQGQSLNWSGITTAIGGGPRLLAGGNVVLNPQKEGFGDVKVFELPTERSAVGITANGDFILVAGVSCSLNQMAHVMAKLGAIDAIAMDSGASSALYVDGQVLVKPGQNLSNVLTFKTN